MVLVKRKDHLTQLHLTERFYFSKTEILLAFIFFILIFLPTKCIILFIFKKVEKLDVHDVGFSFVSLGDVFFAGELAQNVAAEVIQTFDVVIGSDNYSFLETVEHTLVEILLYKVGDHFCLLFLDDQAHDVAEGWHQHQNIDDRYDERDDCVVVQLCKVKSSYY